MSKIKYVRLNNRVITRVVDGYEASHDRGSCGGWYKNKILTEWDVKHGVTEPHKNYTTTLLRIRDRIILKSTGKEYRVVDSAGTFMQIVPNEETDVYISSIKRPYTNAKGELTFDVVKEVVENKMTTLDGVDLSEDDMHTYECFKGLIERYYPEDEVQNGIARNFLKWRQSKDRLIKLFRKHPNWNEREKAIIIDTAEFKRNFSVSEALQELNIFAEEIYKTHKYYTVYEASRIRDIFCTLNDVIRYSVKMVSDNNTAFTTINPDGSYVGSLLNRIRQYNSTIESPFVKNQKATKVINKIFTALDMDKAECYNRSFAKLADKLSVKTIPAKLVFSLNICDFVTMSHGNSWHSCHSFEHKGGWHAGSLSYAMDDVTIVAYGIPVETENKDIYDTKKIFRQLFMLSDDNKSFCQSRMYPADSVYSPNMIHSYFVNALNACTGDTRAYPLHDVRLNTGSGSLQYRDYTRTGEFSCYGIDNVITIGSSCWDFINPDVVLTTSGRIYTNRREHTQPTIFSTETSGTTAAA